MAGMKIIQREFDRAAADKLIAQGISTLAAQVLAARGIGDKADIAPSLTTMPHPEQFESAVDVAKLLAHSIQNDKRICVIGDYDADGMTATALAVLALQQMGADVIWRIPSRGDGYGLSPALVKQAADSGAKTLLTVDNGINAIDAIRAAKTAGMTMLITDHHLGGDGDEADAVAHPKSFAPLAGIAGVGVIFYVMAALKKQLRANIPMDAFLDLVALGTIADCAPMNAVNRALAHAGIMRIRNRKARGGLMRLAEHAKCDISRINGRDIAFRLAPRINAAGRMNKMQTAMDNLFADNDNAARQSVAALEDLNRMRGELQRDILEKARAHILKMEPVPAGIVVADQQWHEGVLGIIAGILGDEYNRPAIVFAADGKGNFKGSGRAPKSWDLHTIVQTADSRRPGLLLTFGGHSRAIGIGASADGIKEFAEVFAAVCAEQSGKEATLEVDTMLPLADISQQSVGELESVVWGESFVAPLFTGEYRVAEEKPIGASGSHRRMLLADDSGQLPAVQFNTAPTGATSVNAAFRLSLGRYNEVQMTIVQTL